MELVSTIESAVHSAVEAVEHPFHTIGARLSAAGEHLATFFGHPYCAPPLADALTTLHGVITDLAQEVAELRVPCPCKPAPTSGIAGTGDVVLQSAATSAGPGDAAPRAAADTFSPGGDFEVVSAADAADFKAWKAAKAAAASFASQA